MPLTKSTPSSPIEKLEDAPERLMLDIAFSPSSSSVTVKMATTVSTMEFSVMLVLTMSGMTTGGLSLTSRREICI